MFDHARTPLHWLASLSTAALVAAFAAFAALAVFVVFVGLAGPLHTTAWARTPAVAPPLRSPSSIQICLLPLGPHDDKLMAVAARGITHVYGFSVKTLAARAMPESAYYKPRDRYRADDILEYINEHVIGDHVIGEHVGGEQVGDHDTCFAIIGFTRYDISTTKGTHKDWGILGLGQIGGPAAVVSTYRLTRRVKRRQAAMRTVKVVNHELGHVLGLEHYDDERGCVMNDAQGTVKTVDKEDGLLCAASRAYLRDTHHIELPAHQTFDWSALGIPR